MPWFSGEARTEQWCTNLPWRANMLRQTSLSPCSRRHILQYLERLLLLQPLLWASNPICYGIMENKTNKKPQTNQILHSLFSTTCSSTVVQTLPAIGNRGTSFRGTVRDAHLEGYLNPWTSAAPASHRPILPVYSLLSGDFQVCMPLVFCQREAV